MKTSKKTQKDSNISLTKKQAFPTVDELLADFPSDFEQRLFKLSEQTEVAPSQQLLTETKQKMIHSQNLQNFESRQTEVKKDQQLITKKKQPLERLVPLFLFISALLMLGISIALHLILSVVIVKEMIVLLCVIAAGESLMLSLIIYFKQTNVTKRSREK